MHPTIKHIYIIPHVTSHCSSRDVTLLITWRHTIPHVTSHCSSNAHITSHLYLVLSDVLVLVSENWSKSSWLSTARTLLEFVLRASSVSTAPSLSEVVWCYIEGINKYWIIIQNEIIELWMLKKYNASVHILRRTYQYHSKIWFQR